MAGALRRKALYSGLLGGSRNWTIVWGVLAGVKLLKRITGDTTEVVFREKLAPGEAFVIRNGERPVTVIGADDARRKR